MRIWHTFEPTFYLVIRMTYQKSLQVSAYIQKVAKRCLMGNIQEDRRKVEQVHILWNSSAKSGTDELKAGHHSMIVEQIHNLRNRVPKMWNSSSKKEVLQILLGHFSTK